MRLYYELAKRSLMRQTAYRAANWAGLVTNCFFGALRSYVFIAPIGQSARRIDRGAIMERTSMTRRCYERIAYHDHDRQPNV